MEVPHWEPGARKRIHFSPRLKRELVGVPFSTNMTISDTRLKHETTAYGWGGTRLKIILGFVKISQVTYGRGWGGKR